MEVSHMLDECEAPSRLAIATIAAECKAARVDVSDVRLSLNDSGSWRIEYFNPRHGNCVTYSHSLAAASRSIINHMRGVSDKEKTRPLNPADFKCAICGTHHKLHVHHIKPRRTHPELASDPDNLITLCANHHRLTYRHEEEEEPFLLELKRKATHG